jgi:Flp pilus assembly pilin Flp
MFFMATQTGAETMDVSPSVPQSIADFLEEKTGASLYEFALLASLVAVVSIIILVALNTG